jgi:predicted N-acyltransferase
MYSEQAPFFYNNNNFKTYEEYINEFISNTRTNVVA